MTIQIDSREDDDNDDDDDERRVSAAATSNINRFFLQFSHRLQSRSLSNTRPLTVIQCHYAMITTLYSRNWHATVASANIALGRVIIVLSTTVSMF